MSVMFFESTVSFITTELQLKKILCLLQDFETNWKVSGVFEHSCLDKSWYLLEFDVLKTYMYDKHIKRS